MVGFAYEILPPMKHPKLSISAKRKRAQEYKENVEKSIFLENRKIKAWCPMCETWHKITVTVQHHIKLPAKWRKFCHGCNAMAGRDYTDYTTSSVG